MIITVKNMHVIYQFSWYDFCLPDNIKLAGVIPIFISLKLFTLKKDTKGPIVPQIPISKCSMCIKMS